MTPRPMYVTISQDTYDTICREIEKLKAENEMLLKENKFLNVTSENCPSCSKCADGMGKVFDEALDKIKSENERLKSAGLCYVPDYDELKEAK